jgi:hypothetical protein
MDLGIGSRDLGMEARAEPHHLRASVICRISRDMAGRAAAVGIILVDQVFFLYLRPMAALPNPVAR